MEKNLEGFNALSHQWRKAILGGMKMGKMFEIFWRVSTNYLISAGLENGDMLPNYPPWCGLSKGSDCDLYLVKMGKI